METSALRAQTHFQAGWNLALGFPQGEFRENVKNTGIGFGLDFTYALPKIPVNFGGTFSVVTYGSESYDAYLDLPFDVFSGNPIKITTDNRILQWDFLVRLQPQKRCIRPYIDGLIGFNYLSTQTSFRDKYSLREFFNRTNFNDMVFSYGGGAGIMIKIYGVPGSRGLNASDKTKLLLDLKVRYLWGESADYLKKGTIGSIGDFMVFDVYQSSTDLLTGQIGLAFEF
ncbi:MAG: hypothetical protein P8184_02075 [Calditrichia bacterium]